MSGFRRLGSPQPFSTQGFPYPSPRRSPDRKTFSPSRHWSIFPSFPESTRTAALSPLNNVREVAHESKCECPFEVPHALFDQERGGQLPSVLAPAKRLLSRPLFWSQRVLNDLPLTVKNRIHHLEEIHIVHPKNVSQLQPTPQSLSLSKNQPYSIYSRNANQVTHWGHGS
ncbi:hypothetical protein Acr_00g0003880 [Actinidia rufa]|uniref:Uncharacterized protein n=1 Tax=Actinidia rufa TaxID=165716 RepID=A0A7J0D7B9_9ERIC|nr:hypothetical protein Acr_00g0001880 [Actinidia rufa]GFS28605.1 hypothetical protein Acr_00g0002760 [Actinidia rufa]GFS28661.1 hypothetical protein Acr_00g0003130 [Actinidia rufa]GFS28768.1 hypothetical protein Acr_00g0003810 [Actinidia rufa]GFS28778.1 hypothetical protein Acr_00g0003880 [Actinidia rufa]